MSSTYKNNISVSIFGQSHSEEIGVVIEGLAEGKTLDLEKLQAFLNRRRPGYNAFSTPRKEADLAIFQSGVALVDESSSENEITAQNVKNIKTTGEQIRAIIRNTNTKSGDYRELEDIPRPGHADFAARAKFGEKFDVRGGGQFSGRMTAPLCIAGGIFKQLLEEKGIHILAHVASIGNVEDDCFDPLCREVYAYATDKKDFPVINDEQGEKMKALILEAKEECDSIGGTVECMITGLPAGIGEPMFDGIENNIAKAAFAIPALKGIEFGNGFAGSKLRGSQNNDPFEMQGDEIRTKTNNQGGILGGITTSMPVVFRVAFKPTPSIAREQDSISYSKKENVKLNIKGRHDPCIVQRAVPCVEAAAALAIYDFFADVEKNKRI